MAQVGSFFQISIICCGLLILATALYYGIKADTLGLGRGTTKVDTTAFCYLLPRLDIEALSKIENAQVPAGYFKSFAQALQTTRMCKGVIISYLGSMAYPDLTAEMADFLLRMQDSRWIICMGVYQEHFILSIRTNNRQGAGQLVQAIVAGQGLAGGHGSMAGGQISLGDQNPEALFTTLTERAIDHLKLPPDEAWRDLSE